MKIIRSARYRIEDFLFKKLAIPEARNEIISKKVLKRYLPRKPSVIDCGAHDGSDTVELAKMFEGKIYAFEPIAHLFERLKIKTLSYSNVQCHQIALSNQNGKQRFYVSEGASDGSSSLLEPGTHLVDHPDTIFPESVEVDALKLDTWAQLNNIDCVDMLWLDMQGAELQMLKESKVILSKVKVIHTEVSVKETYKGVYLYKDYRKFLESMGFKVKLEAIPKGFDMGNVLFVKD